MQVSIPNIMTDQEIRQSLDREASKRPKPISATTFIKKDSTFSTPVWLICEDNILYVVKGMHAGRSIFNDHFIAHLGIQLGAPVAEPKLIIIPDELKNSEPELQNISSGVAHGTICIPNSSNREWLIHTDKLYNRKRFALLSVLYGWLWSNDNQLIYLNNDPYWVYSVDHGHFLPNGPDWTINTLSIQQTVEPNNEIRTACNLTGLEISEAMDCLAKITSEQIISCIAQPPDEWNVSIEERIALVRFVTERKNLMLSSTVNT
jgi:hypothetical protein